MSGRAQRRPESRSRPPLPQDHHRGGLDRRDTSVGPVYHTGRFRPSDFHGRQQFPRHRCVCGLYDHLCLSSVSAGNGYSFSGQVYDGQSGGKRKDRGNSRSVQYHREHYRNVSSDVCDDSGGGHGGDVSYFFGNSAAAGSDLFPEFEGEAKDVCRSAGRLYVLQHFSGIPEVLHSGKKICCTKENPFTIICR